MSLPSDPTIGTQMQTGSAADGFVDLRISSGRMIAVSLGAPHSRNGCTQGKFPRKIPARCRARRIVPYSSERHIREAISIPRRIVTTRQLISTSSPFCVGGAAP